MSIRFWRVRRGREHAFNQFSAPARIAPIELPPSMWLPPLRGVAPEGAPVGIAIGTLKPQREVKRNPWQGPGVLVVEEWQPSPVGPLTSPRRRRRVSVVAGIGALGGMLLLLAALDIGHTVAVGGELEPAAVAVTGIPQAGPGGGDATGEPVDAGPGMVLWPAAPPGEEGGVSAAALAASAPETESKPRWQMPLRRWSAVTDRYGAPRGNGVVHGGIDLALDGMHRSPVYTACEGVAESAGYSAIYGYHVIVDCGEGWSTLYGHLSEIRAGVGEAVTFEDVIGVSGTSGQAQGEHLHFEIRWQGAAVNPERYLDFHIPPGRPLTYDKRDANGNLITPEPPAPPPAMTPPTATPTLTPTPTNTPTPRPTRTAAEEATAKAIKGTVRR